MRYSLDNIQISNFICPVNNWREREEKSRIIIKKDKEFQYNWNIYFTDDIKAIRFFNFLTRVRKLVKFNVILFLYIILIKAGLIWNFNKFINQEYKREREKKS